MVNFLARDLKASFPGTAGYSATSLWPKDSEVVEYPLSRTLSPALVAQYRMQLPDEGLLAAKLHEFYALSTPKDAAAEATIAACGQTQEALILTLCLDRDTASARPGKRCLLRPGSPNSCEH
ncbi:hypothetical protein RT97_05950 [Variovorax paradoxus]|uniref:Uncharacterized protein n=1 Tax=Variovorax paradoxus TaxID=34073 RepID=A0A0D0M180_VARPD|nr:hypothetical protein [Variovorax paradoxus]KIQ35393.1 hypothetical protein RT97_05950 [Variovorax paradoxus]